MTARRIATTIAGALAVLVGLALVAAALMVFTQRDGGYFATDSHAFERASYAIVADDPDLLADPPSWMIDAIRVEGSNQADTDLFIGVAETAAVDRFLTGVPHDDITDLTFGDNTIDDVTYSSTDGTETPGVPELQQIWTTSTAGPGTQTLEWTVECGNWTIVVMNADGSRGIDANLSVGLKITHITAIAWVALASGIASIVAGGWLTSRGLRSPGETVQDSIGDAPPVHSPDSATAHTEHLVDVH